MQIVKLLLATLVLTSSCRTTDPNKSIVSNSGVPDEKNEYPQTLRIEMSGWKGETTCTGQLIDTDLLLTAAHCMLHARLNSEKVNEEYQWTVVLYNSSGAVYFNDTEYAVIDSVTIHPSFMAKVNASLDEINKTQGQWGPGKFGFADQYEKGSFKKLESWKKIEEFPKSLATIAFDEDVTELALVKLKRSEKGKNLNVPLVKLYNKDPEKGQKVAISGYGLPSRNSFPDSVRRIGWTTISAVEPNWVWTRNLGADMNKEGSTIPFSGDSGSMLYDYQTKLGVGILTGSRAGDIDGQHTEFGVFVNLRKENARSFICKAAPQACE